MISELVQINSFQINTIYLLFIPIFIILLFIYWREIQRDGFDEEKGIDLFILAFLSGILVSRFTFAALSDFALKDALFHVARVWTPGFNTAGMFAGISLPVLFFSRAWNWSVYRLTDIISVTTSLGISLFFLGKAFVLGDTLYLFVAFWYFVLFLLLRKARLKHRSGLVFSVFLLSNLFVGLQFYILLLIIGIVNLYFRERKNPMGAGLPKSFLSKVAKSLKKKEKQLEAEQKLLLEEDPYMAPGRDSDNEYLDDVVEDISKGETDLRLSVIKDFKIRVRKALAKIRSGEYGVCEVCGKSISIERLRAYPEATTCVDHSE
jgi:RNA polymerase-binding transcription factor DksA